MQTNDLNKMSDALKDAVRACVESIREPQFGFKEVCYTEKEVRKGKSAGLPYDTHTARDAVWFQNGENIDELKLKNALLAAIAVRDRVRKNNDKRKVCPGAGWLCEIRVNDIYEWLKFVGFLAGDGAGKWIYRGQGDAKWQLRSSLERTLKYTFGKLDEDVGSILDKESEAIEKFRRISSQKLGYRKLPTMDLMALVQHYGGKTRLIDFSDSPLVALYFALEQYDSVERDDDSCEEVDVGEYVS